MENSIQNARVLFDNGQYDRAIDMCTELIEAETDRKDAFLISANSYMFAGLKTPTNEQDNEYFFKSFECACSYAETVEEAYELEREATQAFLNWKKSVSIINFTCLRAILPWNNGENTTLCFLNFPRWKYKSKS